LVTDRNGERKPLTLIRPKYYSVENAEAACGVSYRYLRDQARLLGVRIIKLSGGRRLLIDADDFDRKVAEAQVTEPEQDPTAAVFAQLGWQVPR
jgi:hypothetical protein